MRGHELGIIQKTFVQCFKDIAVLERFDSDGQYFETNDIHKERKRWLVIAAGVNDSEAKELFSAIPKRAEKALIPLNYRSVCKISILFVLRPYKNDLKQVPQSTLVAPFAPKKGIPLIEIRQSYVRILNFPDNKNKLNNVRWEWDLVSSFDYPTEKWLRKWKDDCGFNPAHLSTLTWICASPLEGQTPWLSFFHWQFG
ncbi:MAG: hypothetical protein ACE5IR_20430 [bacterium]